MKPTN